METQVDYGKKTRAGNYDCCILYECGNRGPEPVIPAPETTVGLKYPVPHFYVTDSGDMADPPHWLKASQEIGRASCRERV